MYDCRPMIDPQVIQQRNLEAAAAHYTDDNATTAGPTTQTATTANPPYQVPAAAPVAPTGGGLDMTTLLLIGVALFFVMKR